MKQGGQNKIHDVIGVPEEEKGGGDGGKAINKNEYLRIPHN